MRAPGPIETELKYSVRDPEALRRWLDDGALEAAGFARGPSVDIELEDRYVDTPDERLAAAGYAARLRRTGDSFVISLKGRENGGGGPRALHLREEIEAPASDSLDPAAWPESPGRALVEEVAGEEPLRERFRLRQRRWERELAAGGGIRAVLSLQQAEVWGTDRCLASQHALEVELRHDHDGPLGALSRAIEQSGLVEPDTRTKEEWAEAVLHAARTEGGSTAASAPADIEPPRLATPPHPDVRGDDLFAEAGRKILRFHLARMLERETGVRSGEDLEDVHKMRVATRRMRAAWRVFGESYRPRDRRRYVKEVRTVAGRLGAVRDLDVLLEGARRYAEKAANGGRSGLEPLTGHWEERRDEARAEMTAMLDSASYRRFVDDYLLFVETPGLGSSPAVPGAPSRVRDMAPSRTWAGYEQLRAYDPVFRWADDVTLHEVRIHGKRFRYALEFFREPIGAAVDPLITLVTELQDGLGAMHDASVAVGLARGYLAGAVARGLEQDAVESVAGYIHEEERIIRKERARMTPLWDTLMARETRESLGGALAAL